MREVVSSSVKVGMGFRGPVGGVMRAPKGA